MPTVMMLLALPVLLLVSPVLAATYDATASGFTIDVPDDWSKSREGDPSAYSYTFMTPDEKLAVGISAIKIQPGTPLADIIPVFEQNAFANAESRSDDAKSFNGMFGRLKSYKWTHNGQPLGVAAFYGIAQDHFYAVWTLASFNEFRSLAGTADKVTNSFNLVPIQAQTTQAAPAPAAPAAVKLETFNTGTALVGQHTIAVPMNQFSPDTAVIYAGFRTNGSLQGKPLILQFTYKTGSFTVFTNELLPDNWESNPVVEGHMSYSKPNNGWPAGDYKVDILHDGTLLGTTEFSVR
jgi:hypothetical protein